VTSAKPLVVAAGNGKLDAVQILLKEMGANANQAQADGFIVLCVAAQMGHEQDVRCLVKEFDADVNIAMPKGITPLYNAAQARHEHVVRCLLEECGANVNQVTENGCSPLYIAAQMGHEQIVRFLVKEFGADVNIALHVGSTPLIVVVWLTKHGADSQASHPRLGTAAEHSKAIGAPADQTAYLEARTHCAKPGCSGAGLMKRLPYHILLWQGVPGGALAGAQGAVQGVGCQGEGRRGGVNKRCDATLLNYA
jgi:hypothetical protein